MPVKKGRDFNEMSTSRQLEYESKAYRLNTVYAVGLLEKENAMFTLSWQPPYDWPRCWGSRRPCGGRGRNRGDLRYARSLTVGNHRGLVRVIPDLHTHQLHVTLSPGLQPVAAECLAKMTRLFDLTCCPQQIVSALGSLGAARPGLRLPGSVDAFEQGVRAILGQLVSVAMAAKLTAKVAHTYGDTLEDAPEYVCFPTLKRSLMPIHYT